MAQYAYNYNDIYDEYLVQAAPKTAPEPEVTAPQTEYRRIGRTREQVIKAGQKKFKIFLAKLSVTLAAFIAVGSIALISQQQLGDAKQRLDDVNAAYHMSLEKSNELKLQLDNILARENIPEYAEKTLGLEKIPDKRKIFVDVSRFQ